MILGAPLAFIAGLGILILLVLFLAFYAGIYALTHKGEAPEFPFGPAMLVVACGTTLIFAGLIQLLLMPV